MLIYYFQPQYLLIESQVISLTFIYSAIVFTLKSVKLFEIETAELVIHFHHLKMK